MTAASTFPSERVLAPPGRRISPAVAQATVAGFVGSLLVATTAPVWRNADATWRLTLPFFPYPGGAVFSSVTFVLGVLLLSFGWIRLGGAVSRSDRSERMRLWISTRTMALWALPIMLGPPLLSNDVYSYAAQGEIASRGLDPTVVGPWALGGGRFFRAADEVWHTNPSPYGPLWNQLSSWVVQVTGHDPSAAVWGFRVVVVLSVLMSGWAIVRLARQLGVDPAVALVLGIANPVVLLHLVGGIHNDGVMMALLLVGLSLVRDRRRLLAFVVLSAAVAIKLPAAAGLAYLGWSWAAQRTTWWRDALRAGAAVVAGFLAVIALSVQFQMSQGWVTALKGTGKVTSTFSPATLSGRLAAGVLQWFHFAVPESTVINVFRLGAMLLAAGVAWLLLWHSRRWGAEVGVGLTLFATVVLGPVLWPWYLPPAIALVAVRGAERVRPALSVWCVALALFVFPTSVGAGVGSGIGQAIFGLCLLVVLATFSLAAQWLFGQPVPGRDTLTRLLRRGAEPA